MWGLDSSDVLVALIFVSIGIAHFWAKRLAKKYGAPIDSFTDTMFIAIIIYVVLSGAFVGLVGLMEVIS